MTFDFSSKKELIAWLTNCSSHDAELEQFDFDSKTQTVRAAFSNPCFQNIRIRFCLKRSPSYCTRKNPFGKPTFPPAAAR